MHRRSQHTHDRQEKFSSLMVDMRSFLGAIIWLCILMVLWLNVECKRFLHERPNQHKSVPGWQEPGLWRPKWVLERDFDATQTTSAYKDRLYVKLKPDRTISVLRSRNRPWLQWRKLAATVAGISKKPLFENGLGSERNNVQSTDTEESLESIYSADGTWSFNDEAPMPTGRVVIETKEKGPDGSLTRIRHECRCDWGRLDDYAARFRRGRLYKYKGVRFGSDVPIGKYPVGTFTLRANAQHPLVSKDFQAFQ